MRKLFVGFCAPAAFAMAMTVAACSKGGPASAPAPSARATASAQPAGSISGATIAGTIMSSAGTASLRPMGAAMTVSVVGTSIAATVDAAGRFTLQNVPSGDVTLAFTGNGADARITIAAVTDHEQIDIVVNVNGTTADADETEREEPDNRAEVEGQIQSINTATRTLVVGRRQTMLVVPVGTPIHHGSTAVDFAHLVAGERIHAHATKSGTTFTATDVEVQNENAGASPPGNDQGHDRDNEGNEGEVSGAVSGAAAGHACPAFTFSVGSTTVTTNTSTTFKDTSCAGVVNGVRVKVKGTRTSATAITATKVEKE